MEHLTHTDYCSLDCMRAHADELQRQWIILNRRINSEILTTKIKASEPEALGGDE